MDKTNKFFELAEEVKMERCYMCNDLYEEVIEMGLVNIWGDIPRSVFICQCCRERLVEASREEADFYDYPAGLWVRWDEIQ
jgi:hypothetical protein